MTVIIEVFTIDRILFYRVKKPFYHCSYWSHRVLTRKGRNFMTFSVIILKRKVINTRKSLNIQFVLECFIKFSVYKRIFRWHRRKLVYYHQYSMTDQEGSPSSRIKSSETNGIFNKKSFYIIHLRFTYECLCQFET